MADDGVEPGEGEQAGDAAECDDGEANAKADEQLARRPDAWNPRQRHDLCFQGEAHILAGVAAIPPVHGELQIFEHFLGFREVVIGQPAVANSREGR